MTDEINEKVANWRTRAGLWLKAFGGFYATLMPWSLIVTLAIIAGLFVAWLTWHSTSETERQAEDARTGTILNDAAVNVQANAVKEAEAQSESAGKAAEKAREQAERARQKPRANVNIQDAMDNCERVYPGECK